MSNIMADRNLPLDHFRAILFDLDGTLLDSFASHFKAYEVTFAKFGITLTEASFLQSYAPDWYQTYQALGLPRECWETANAHWRQEAAKQEPPLFAGVKETLLQLETRYGLGLVTSGSKKRVLRDLERTGIAHLFQAVVSGDDVSQPKPASEGLEAALKQLGVEAHQAVYIGDTDVDYATAKGANVAFLGVTSQFSRALREAEYVQLESVSDLRHRLIF